MTKTTLSVIKADIGGFVGHSAIHPDLIIKAEEELQSSKDKGQIKDFRVLWVGDDMALVMTHDKGEDCEEIHKLGWDTFVEGTKVAKKLKLYGAGQDLLSEGFSGNIKGMGPGCAEMEFEERTSEPFIVFLADKTSPGAWNFPAYKMFADPFNTPGLVIDENMHAGFEFDIMDVKNNKIITLKAPEESYKILAFIGAVETYVIKNIRRRGDKIPAATMSTDKLSLLAGKYIGKDDPAMIIRCQSGLPAVGEVTNPFAFPHLVPGWMRGSHTGPMMPCSFEDCNPSRFDGPPRVIGAGFQIADGMLVGPRDMFNDPGFDNARQKANDVADYMRMHGPFEPHRLPPDQMEYTTLPKIQKEVKKRWIESKDGPTGKDLAQQHAYQALKDDELE